MMYWPDGMGPWGFAMMGLATLLFWALLVVGIVALVRYMGRPASRGWADNQAAERILAERYARGDIEEQDFRQRLQVLRSGGPRA